MVSKKKNSLENARNNARLKVQRGESRKVSMVEEKLVWWEKRQGEKES